MVFGMCDDVWIVVFDSVDDGVVELEWIYYVCV